MKEPIAIVGSACRFPGGANSPAKLWKLLKDPVDVLCDFPEDRLNLKQFYHKNGEHHGSTNVVNKSYLLTEDCRNFDASFFKISPLEAEGMDPQQRLLLEVTYEALEAAGCTLEQMKGSKTAVMVGAMTADFSDIQFRDTEVLPNYSATGVSRSILSNRISYFYDLKGPSVTIDTACSSSLVALHQAVLALRNGDCSSALVAGCALLLDPTMYIAESKLHMLSPTARSRMWDSAADGYARGEGFAAIYLKPLRQAILDGDHIECLIRETGVNSDGRTPGITMPSSTAQTDLIRHTYQQAGLDMETDRCQFFECHGTGTPAGDPKEAQAIKEAFFPKLANQSVDSARKLYVGSIKTVVGHLEGCAGLAGLLKSSLAIQHGVIPPNMHFNKLNPAIRPFYDNLEVPTKAIQWPETYGQPRRASINSFGFGGTNAHVILEAYTPNPSILCQSIPQHLSEEIDLGPLPFSANSATSLRHQLDSFSQFLTSSPDMDLPALSRTLQTNRSTHKFKAFVPGGTRQQILQSINKLLEEDSLSNSQLGVRSQFADPNEIPGILGIFTGQGAQYAGMGRQMYQASEIFREAIETCDTALRILPDAPAWSIKDELFAEKSRLSEAIICQPLCTALQIALVNVLHAAGFHFDAVVGHSSGEMGAVYAAGILSAQHAMQIAYYRGVHATLAAGKNGEKGAMMAVSSSYEDALTFCDQAAFRGRICVAASNAPTSVTLSGDEDAIMEAKSIFDKDGKFARLLVVDTAYHSHHMTPCSGPYLASLKACNIKVNSPKNNCIWISSVRGDVDLLEESLESLTAEYWVQNMVNPVLFSQATECSLYNGGPFDIIVEVGPHHALKGPTSQTFKTSLGSCPPYVSPLARGLDDAISFSTALGTIWSHLGPAFVDFQGYRKACRPSEQTNILKNLPSYAWDHEKLFWKESRISRNYRLRNLNGNELIGRRMPDDSEFEMRWRNVLRQDELPWTKGHQFQGQVIFPGAGYISMAIEAGLTIANGRPVKLIEVSNLSIPKGLVIAEGTGIEIIFSVKVIRRNIVDKEETSLEAEFACYMYANESSDHAERGCSGTLLIHFGTGINDILPSGRRNPTKFAPVDMDRFYDAMLNIGLNYTGVFRPLMTASRIMGASRASASWNPGELEQGCIFHPAILDVGFQAGFAAFASPATDSLTRAYLPAHIEHVAFNPNVHFHSENGSAVDIEAFVTDESAAALKVDVVLSQTNSAACGMQVQGLTLKAISECTASDDRHMFAEISWGADFSYRLNPVVAEVEQPEEQEMVHAMQRTAIYYFQHLLGEVKPEEVSNFLWHNKRLYEATVELLEPIKRGEMSHMPIEWLSDSFEDIVDLFNQHPESIDLKLMHAAGEHLVSVIRGENQMIEYLMEDDMLTRLYTEGHGFRRMNAYLAQMVRQMTHKFPRLNILEIGAGTGGTTKHIFDAIDSTYKSYTYTDISAGFFEKAANRFEKERHKMNFQVLDIEKDLADQGFEDGKKDVVIAANVLHATSRMADTMRNVRSLLKPGGYLLMVELSGNLLQMPLVMGGLSGWWLGADEGRRLGPALTPVQWDELLQTTGFSGIDYITFDMLEEHNHSFTLIVSQAVDDQYNLIRQPLSSVPLLEFENTPIIIGGNTLTTSRLIYNIQTSLGLPKGQTTIFKTLDALSLDETTSGRSIICLAELDKPLFTDSIDEKKLEALQSLFAVSKNVLWVTQNRRADSPYSNMVPGIGRALRFELPSVTSHFLDFEGVPANPKVIVESFLRLCLHSKTSDGSYDSTYAVEPEVIFNGDTMLVPRVRMDRARNDRFNALRRSIRHPHREDSKLKVELKDYGSSVKLIEHIDVANKSLSSTEINFKTEYSTAISLGPEPLYLCAGRHSTDGATVFAVTDVNASVTSVTFESAFTTQYEVSLNESLTASVAANLYLNAIMSYVSTKSTMILFEPPSWIAEAFTKSAHSKLQNVLLVQADTGCVKPGWTALHPHASKREITEFFPSSRAFFVNFSLAELGARLETTLGQRSNVQVLGLSSLAINISVATSDLLEQAYQSSINVDLDITPQVITLDRFEANPSSVHQFTSIIDWNIPNGLNVTIGSMDSERLFSSDKTYFMVGLTGEIGQSLCRWMARRGAVHFALASRSADVDEGWLEEMRFLGVQINVFKMDVSNRNSVQSAVKEIRSTMPPVAGVCNAAMVLLDKTFVNIDVEATNRQLQPKVNGSKYLDEMFKNDPLDFFILFGSVASIVGNGGQSIYHAANLFMSSLAAQRRKRGFAASVMWIGMLVDIGYIARTGRHLEEYLRSHLYQPLGEPDLHQLFIEAIVAGSPESGETSDIILGLTQFTDHPNATTRPPWYPNPQFGHLILEADTSSVHEQSDSAANSARQKLESATVDQPEVAAEAVQELLCNRLAAMMRLMPESINVNGSLTELGFDSLLAVEVRTWILKELGVDVPLLRILSQESIVELCKSIANQYLQIRHVKSSGEATSKLSSGTAVVVPPLLSITEAPAQISKSIANEPTNDALSRPKISEVCNASSDEDDTHSSVDDSADADVAYESSRTSDLHVGNPKLNHLFKAQDSTLVPTNEVSRQEQLSFAESRLWFLRSLLNDATNQNITIEYSLTGPLNIARFEAALRTVVSRHHILKTSFVVDQATNDVVQRVMSRPGEIFNHIPSATMNDSKRVFNLLQDHAWDLESGMTFKAVLLSHGAQSHTLVFGYHHIVMDGMSWHIFLRELNLAYANKTSLPPIAKQYVDFSVHQGQIHKQRGFNSQIEYWQRHHQNQTEPLPLLPFARVKVRKPNYSHECFTVTEELPPKLVANIKRACQKLRITPFHFHLSALQVLLSKILDISNLCIGVTDANRTDEAFKDTVGFFLNLLPLQFDVNQNDNFRTLTKNTFNTAMNGYQNSSVPFDLIVQNLNVPKSPSHTPLFQVAFNYRSGNMVRFNLGDCHLDLTNIEDAKHPYDFALNITPIPETDSCGVQISSQKYVYDEEGTELIMRMYVSCLSQLSMKYEMGLCDLDIQTNVSKEHATSVSRGLCVDGALSDTLLSQVENFALLHADKIAVADTINEITYGELMFRVQYLAHTLLDLGIATGSRVAVLCKPSINSVICLMAILHVGAVYVPLDLSLPSARHAAIIDDCKPELLLHQSETLVNAQNIDVAQLKLFNVSTAQTSQRAVVSHSNGKQPAFLLYTSGSTGKPKGTILNQSGIMNYAIAKGTRLSLMADDVVLQQSSLGFDMSIAQIYNGLVNGAKLVIVPQARRGDPTAIAQLMLDHKVSFTVGTPSEILTIVKYGRGSLQQYHSWRNCCLGGETVTHQILTALRSLSHPSLVVTDCYGPTEISASTTFNTAELSLCGYSTLRDYHSVGTPIQNTSIYILDEAGSLLPLGAVGEICVGGIGVANGYLDRPDITASKFVSNQFVSQDELSNDWNKLYKTGDKGRLLKDGSLIYMGRMDDDRQVKLRGLRIELDEVATHLLQVAETYLTDAVVILKDESESLVAYVTLREDQTVAPADLMECVARLPLPKYMWPSVVVPLEKFPLSTNGKVDHKALKAMSLPRMNTEAGNQRTTTITLAEGEVRLLWEAVLQIHDSEIEINARSDFFLLGGSSLHLVKLQNLIKEEIGVAVPLADLYQFSTLSQMANRVSQEKIQHELEVIDWGSETAVPTEMLQLTTEHRQDASEQSNTAGAIVLLTGATNFLGSHILQSLLENPRVQQIHCIAVPPTSRYILPESPKIVQYIGSISDPSLSLSEVEQQVLGSTVTHIIHAGSVGHCLNNYQSLRSANYLSTKFLAAMALYRNIPLHYISSNRVTLLSGSTSLPPMSVSTHYPPTDGSEGFTATKWASERFLEQLSTKTGLPVHIHRNCAVIGDQAPADDAQNALLKFSRMMQTVPKFDNMTGFFDFEDIDKVAASVISTVFPTTNTTSSGGNAIEFHHHSSNVQVRVDELAPRLRHLYGHEFHETDLKEWIEQAGKRGLNPLIAAYVNALVEKGQVMRFPYLGSS